MRYVATRCVGMRRCLGAAPLLASAGLRRTIQVRVFIGVGSNPTFVTTPLSFFFIPCIYLSAAGAMMLYHLHLWSLCHTVLTTRTM
jgi:hypothetical protein